MLNVSGVDKAGDALRMKVNSMCQISSMTFTFPVQGGSIFCHSHA